ncbi:3-hydroxyacyl-CoA dehydrogenase [Ottowia sp.]|uniref:YncE family protein n=1 Tax=Ottowia sp. TaxID=1898956 RepID=UPI0025EDA903|nr:3-hydroxyacyl-CoA dehydrogenase [Ottowia sp.]MBK6613557.1 3-hydroxyacyl-CoA dehydrogenase [Ottowia sp.]
MSTNSDRLIFLSLGRVSRVMSMGTDGTDLQTLAEGLESAPDGVAVDPVGRHIFISYMGLVRVGEDYWENDGHVERCNYDGSDRQVIVPVGSFTTGKQITFNEHTRRLYWCDREGMRVMSCRPDGSDLTTLVQTGAGEDRTDPTRHCVGVAVDAKGGYIYWTLKGKPNGNEGRIVRAPLALPAGADPARRTDIETLLGELPEPIDLDWDEQTDTLYWTDRGDPPKGNTLNRAKVRDGKAVDHEILLSNLREAIGLALDLPNRRAFITELIGGAVQVADLDRPGEGQVVYEGKGRLTGLAYLRA